ncbi:MAG: hypothetical protein HOC18_02155 [Candidatus Marinimicrobia bacterium]|jgi:hypothetical protein|nr:hypothetical protein [Candidatus Neomarinimicrobiota bacterium]
MAKGSSGIFFGDEWVDKNPWMGEVNDESLKEQPNSMCMFINFPNGVPIPKLRKEWDRIVNHKAEQDKNLSIFHEMMKEKSIRPGVGSVGKAHRGWGNSLRK